MKRILFLSLFVAVASLSVARAETPKALSPDQVEDYLAGKGMGMALAAELNRYPGPSHVLELGDRLGLTDEQRREAAAVRSGMAVHARAIGRAIIEKETSLEGLFAEEAADESGMAAVVREIAALQGELRLAHLKAHVAIKRLLSPDQIARYEVLRGRANPAGDDQPGTHRH